MKVLNVSLADLWQFGQGFGCYALSDIETNILYEPSKDEGMIDARSVKAAY